MRRSAPAYAGSANWVGRIRSRHCAGSAKHRKFRGDPQNVTIFRRVRRGFKRRRIYFRCRPPRGYSPGRYSKAVCLLKGPVGSRERSARLAARVSERRRVQTPGRTGDKAMRNLLKPRKNFQRVPVTSARSCPGSTETVIERTAVRRGCRGAGQPGAHLIGTTGWRRCGTSLRPKTSGWSRSPRALFMKQLQAVAGTVRPGVLEYLSAPLSKLGRYGRADLHPMPSCVFPRSSWLSRRGFPGPVLHVSVYVSFDSTYKNFGPRTPWRSHSCSARGSAGGHCVQRARSPPSCAGGCRHGSLGRLRAHRESKVTPGPPWKPYDKTERSTMELGYQIRPISNPLAEQRDVWAAFSPWSRGWLLMQLNQ